MTTSDTIAALSSPALPAARIIVRASGPSARQIAHSICPKLIDKPSCAQRAILQFDHLSIPSWIYTFHTPHSYTGEDLVEFHIPGNPLLARMLLDQLIKLGARPADPGEFTARAYFNGQMDLTRAEGVAAAIAANSQAELSAARRLLAGELARRLTPLMEKLADTLALTEVGIDFTDEDVSFLSSEKTIEQIQSAENALRQLIAESARFDRLAHEPHFILAGRPNAGKSTLLNALAGHARAVVSPIAGTTRDALSAQVLLEKGAARITDIAGLEELDPPATDQTPPAQIARQMRAHALTLLQSADFVLLIHDITDTNPPLSLPRKPDLLIFTKLDLETDQDSSRSYPPSESAHNTISISALTGTNLDTLRHRLSTLAFGDSTSSETLALNARHLSTINNSIQSLESAQHATESHLGAEIIALELRSALDSLGQILGQVTPDDVLGRVFSAFCIGK